MTASKMQAVKKFKSLTQNKFKKWVANWVIENCTNENKLPLDLNLYECFLRGYADYIDLEPIFNRYKQDLNLILGDNYCDWQPNKNDFLCLENDTKTEIVCSCFKFVLIELLDFVRNFVIEKNYEKHKIQLDKKFNYIKNFSTCYCGDICFALPMKYPNKEYEKLCKFNITTHLGYFVLENHLWEAAIIQKYSTYKRFMEYMLVKIYDFAEINKNIAELNKNIAVCYNDLINFKNKVKELNNLGGGAK